MNRLHSVWDFLADFASGTKAAPRPAELATFAHTVEHAGWDFVAAQVRCNVLTHAEGSEALNRLRSVIESTDVDDLPAAFKREGERESCRTQQPLCARSDAPGQTRWTEGYAGGLKVGAIASAIASGCAESLAAQRSTEAQHHAPVDPQPETSCRQPEQTRLLWIDHQKMSSDADIQSLNRAGYRIDCAGTGAAGLNLARARRYHGILLDLRLPDIPGLSLLATLRSEEVETPVLILTGWGDFESARIAGYLGVDGFESKPLLPDELQAAVRRLVQEPLPRRQCPDANTSGPLPDDLRAGFSSIAHLLEQLQRISSEQARQSEYRHDERCRNLVVTLIRSLSNLALPMPAFLACAATLKNLANADPADSTFNRTTSAEERILEALGKSEPSNACVAVAIGALRSGAARHQRLRLQTVAASMTERITPERLGKLIKEQTGFWFTDWRTGLLLRFSVSPLLNTDDDVKQIAGNSPAFKNLSHFDHEFHRFFGLSPTRFRHFWHSHGL